MSGATETQLSIMADPAPSIPGTVQCVWPLPCALIGSRNQPRPSMPRKAVHQMPSSPSSTSLVISSRSSAMCPQSLHATALIRCHALGLARPHSPKRMCLGEYEASCSQSALVLMPFCNNDPKATSRGFRPGNPSPVVPTRATTSTT